MCPSFVFVFVLFLFCFFFFFFFVLFFVFVLFFFLFFVCLFFCLFLGGGFPHRIYKMNFVEMLVFWVWRHSPSPFRKDPFQKLIDLILQMFSAFECVHCFKMSILAFRVYTCTEVQISRQDVTKHCLPCKNDRNSIKYNNSLDPFNSIGRQ